MNSRSKKRMSYYKKLLDALTNLGIRYHVYDHQKDDVDKLRKLVKGIILSGSILKLSQPLKNEDIMVNFVALHHFDVPVLGICFGCQLLHMMYGGKLRDIKKYECNDHMVTMDTSHPLFMNHEKKLSYRFCFSDLIISHKSADIKEIAWFTFLGKKQPCAFQFTENVYGCMFHPEYHHTTYGILYNFSVLTGTLKAPKEQSIKT